MVVQPPRKNIHPDLIIFARLEKCVYINSGMKIPRNFSIQPFFNNLLKLQECETPNVIWFCKIFKFLLSFGIFGAIFGVLCCFLLSLWDDMYQYSGCISSYLLSLVRLDPTIRKNRRGFQVSILHILKMCQKLEIHFILTISKILKDLLKCSF